jgi:predicted anti-sigma-YlaC factor YlaD
MINIGTRTIAGSVAALALAAPACSVKKYTLRTVADALSTSASSSMAADNDPELIRSAAPFSLKLVEMMLQQNPRHPGLLLAAASGFTEYSYAFVQLAADEVEDKAAAAAMRQRAAKLYLRARDYGMQGLELKRPGFAQELKANPKAAVQQLKTSDVPFMYWTGASWAGALAASRDMFMLPQIPQFEALILRALELDETWDSGRIHTFMITYEMASPTRTGDKAARAKQHFERAVELSHGRQAGPYVAYAENVLTVLKDRAGFEGTLKKALAIDVNAEPGVRLQNIIFQRRARWLLGRTSELFKAADEHR